MKSKTIKGLLSVTILSMLIWNGCVDLPENVAPPRYDVTLNFPINDTTYSIDDALKDDSTLTVSKDPATLGLLYYSQKQNISTFTVGDKLTFDGFSTHFSKAIGSVRINNPQPVEIGLRVEDWASGVSSGSTMIFPENVGDVNVPFKKIPQFKSVTLESGQMKVKIVNLLPVDIQLQGITIKNAVSGTIVANRPKSSPVDLQPQDSTEISFDLTGKTIEDSLFYIGTLYTPGSHGQQVQIPADAGTRITVSLTNLSISRVEAVLPAQDPFTKTGTVTMDDSTYLQEAVFDSGSFNITFNNNLDLDIQLDLKIDNLKKPDGNPYTVSLLLGRKESNKSISEPSLSGWSITGSSGQATNELSYSATVTALASDQPRVLSKDDSISVQIDFSKIIIRSVSGKIKPTKFEISNSTFDLDLGDFKDKFQYKEINLGDPDISLSLTSSANIKLLLNGDLEATNGTQTQNMSLKNVLINSPGTTVINLKDYGLKDFMNSFLSNLPDHFVFGGNAVVNPYYETGSVSKYDSIYGNAEIKVPLEIGIKGGVFKDTVTIDKNKDADVDMIDAINYGVVYLETKNKIPVSIVFKGSVLDSTNNFLFSLPPQGSSADSLVIPAPTVDNDGFAAESGYNKQMIKLTGEQAKHFLLGGIKIIMSLKLSTPPPNNNNPVNFRNTDWISVKMYGTINYRVNN